MCIRDSLCLEDELCRLRIRDNGVNFNPLEYQYDSEDFDIHGIELVKKVSKSMDYIRAIDMNNTITVSYTHLDVYKRQVIKTGGL